MRDAGYFTANVRTFPPGFGFAGVGKTDWNFTYSGKPFDSDDWQDLKGRQPFFAQVNFQETHRPFNAPRRAGLICESGVFVKRIIGVPGDRWEERHGYVYIDGKRLKEPYVKAARRDTETVRLSDILPGATVIPKDEYLMMGDNRRQSCDSRRWGLVPRSALIGEVFLTYWPLGRLATH